MSFIIRTEYVNVNGTGKVKATGLGKQRTIPYAPEKSSDANHGAAAGTLALVVGLTWSDAIWHDSNDSGTKHGFSFPGVKLSK